MSYWQPNQSNAALRPNWEEPSIPAKTNQLPRNDAELFDDEEFGSVSYRRQYRTSPEPVTRQERFSDSVYAALDYTQTAVNRDGFTPSYSHQQNPAWNSIYADENRISLYPGEIPQETYAYDADGNPDPYALPVYSPEIEEASQPVQDTPKRTPKPIKLPSMPKIHFQLGGKLNKLLLGIAVLLAFVVILFSVKIIGELQRSENTSAINVQQITPPEVQAASSEGNTNASYLAQRSTYAALLENVSTDSRTKITRYPNNPLNNLLPEIEALQGANEDAVGILNISGILQENVYQQAGSPLYYYSHDSYKQSSAYGAVYADPDLEFTRPPENIVLYGHSSTEGKCFSALKQFGRGNEVFVAQNTAAYFTGPYETAAYRLFSVVEMDGSKEASNFRNMIQTSFQTDAEMMNFVVEAKALSLYPIPVEVEPSDRLLTLSTFSNEGNSLILVYRMQRTNEY